LDEKPNPINILNLHIAAIEYRDIQIEVYNTIIKYLEIFISKHGEFKDLTKINDLESKFNQLIKVKDEITNLITKIRNLSDDQFNIYQKDAVFKLYEWNSDG
jgi:hypothetical protein